MNDDRTPEDPGQNPEPHSSLPSSSQSPRLPQTARLESELLATLRKADTCAKRLLAVRGRDDARVDLSAPFALRTDGALLINAHYLQGSQIDGRELWIGVVVEPEHAAEIRSELSEAVLESACRLVGRLASQEGESDTDHADPRA